VKLLCHYHDKRQRQDDGCRCHSADQLWSTATLNCSDRNFWYRQPPAAGTNIINREQQERYVPGCIQCGELTDWLTEVLLAAGEGLYSIAFVCLMILAAPGLYGMKKNTEHWRDEYWKKKRNDLE
jgi:hypothetical protein